MLAPALETDTIHRAIALRRAGQIDEALGLFRSVLAANPANEWARIEVANALKSANKADDAVSLLLEGLADGRRSPNIRLSLAEIFQAAGDAPRALAALTQATAEAPQSSKPHIALIKFHTAAGRFDEAVAAATHAANIVSDATHRSRIFEEAAAAMALPHAKRVDLHAPIQRRGREIANAVLISMVKDEDDIILHQLKHHYALGIRYFAIADNGSSDSTAARIEQFRSECPSALVLRVDDPVVAYYQDVKLTALARYAVDFFRSAHAQLEWILPLDADEFICIPEGETDLRGILDDAAAAGHRIVAYHLCNMATATLLEELPAGQAPFAAFTVKAHFHHRPVCKVAYRNSPEAKLAMGSHFVVDVAEHVSDIWPAASAGVYLAHFPYRSLKQVRNKVLNGGRAVEKAQGLIGAGHWRGYFERYRVEGEPLIARILENYVNQTKQNA